MSAPRFLDRTSPPHVGTLVGLTGLSALAMAVFLPSLPSMAREFGVGADTMGLSVSLYLLVNAALQLAVGPLGDRYGRRVVLLGGIALFALASLGCALASSAWMFLAFRMMQAAIVVAMVLSRAIIRDLFDQARAASVIGYVMMAMSIVPMVSPAIGGWIDGAFGWRVTFHVLAALGLLVLIVTYLDLGETLRERGKSFRAQARDYPALLRSRQFWGYTLASSFSSGAFFAYLSGTPNIAAQVYGLTEQQLGIALGAPAVGYFLGNFFSGRFSARIGAVRMTRLGGLVVLSGMAILLALVLLGYDRALVFFVCMTLLGLGNGILLPNAMAGMISVNPALAGTASGLGGSLQIAGGAVLAAVAGQLLVHPASSLPLVFIMVGAALASLVSTALLRGD